MLHFLDFGDPISRANVIKQEAYPKKKCPLHDQCHRAMSNGAVDILFVELHYLLKLIVVNHIEFSKLLSYFI
jgi:hypothetical protein